MPSDFHLIHAYPEKMFKWGYFPETRCYKEGELWEKKEKEGIHVVWAGRFIPLKHPEYMIRLAKDVPACRIHMAGSGELQPRMEELAREYGVEERVIFYGFQKPEKVREIMERCHIHVFTSNHLEGWGAVVNEAMNSGCAVVANVQAGAVPYLVRQKVNGIAYPAGNYEKMKEAVEYLVENPGELRKMGQAAYETIIRSWNAEHAAKALKDMVEGIKAGAFRPEKEGPLSPAPVVSPGKMFRFMENNT